MNLRDLSFSDPRLSRRLLLGALLAAVFSPVGAVPDLVRAATGPRFQLVRGTEYDVWVGAGATAAAAAVTCLAVCALGPLWRRRPVATLLGAACGLPLAAAYSVASAPHGPTPYSVDWAVALLVAAACGGAVAWSHPEMARGLEDGRILARARRLAKGQRAAG